MDAIELLTTQHREMEKQLDAIAKDIAGSHALFLRVADELAAHVTVEETVFYPAARSETTEDILLESLEEHLSLKRLLADLLELKPSEETFEPKFKVLKEQIEHHHKEEEKKLFPKVKKLLPDVRRELLGAEMESARAQIDQGTPRFQVANETDVAAKLE